LYEYAVLAAGRVSSRIASAAAALLATSAAAYRTGLLDSLPAKLLLLLQTQQCRSPRAYMALILGVMNLVGTFIGVTEASHCLARALLPAALLHKALQCVAQLLQQIPRCGALLPAAAPGTSTASGSSSSSSGRAINRTHEFYFSLQVTTARFLSQFVDMRSVTRPQLDADSAAVIPQLLMHHAVQELLLQCLVGCVAMLHQHHELKWQQQQQQSSGDKGLLRIPAFHQDMLQLLPGGQDYLDAAADWAAAKWGSDEDERLEQGREQAAVCVQILGAVFSQCKSVPDQRRNSSAPALSAVAVRLMLQLQLLAAGELQRQQQQQPGRQNQTAYLLMSCNCALLTQLQAAVQAAGGSRLPPEVLQQAGLQLLQALAAPLQQLQALTAPVQQLPPQEAASMEQLGIKGDLEMQLYALMAAAAGVLEEQQVAAGGAALFMHASHCTVSQLSRANIASLLQACIPSDSDCVAL
jgi:hypothetical protein